MECCIGKEINLLLSLSSYWGRAGVTQSTQWLGYMLDVRGSIHGKGWNGIFFLSAIASRPTLGPPSLLLNEHRGLFPCGLSSRGVKLTTHLHLMPRFKNTWGYTSTLPYIFMELCLIKLKLTTHLHLVPRSKNAWSYTSPSQYVFMMWCLVKHRDFTFYFYLYKGDFIFT